MLGFSFPPGSNMQVGRGAGFQLIPVLDGTERLRIETENPWGSVIQETTTQAIADLVTPIGETFDLLVTTIGTNQATAYGLRAFLTTVGSAPGGTGIVMSNATAGSWGLIYNGGGGPFTLYAFGAGTINGVASKIIPYLSWVIWAVNAPGVVVI